MKLALVQFSPVYNNKVKNISSVTDYVDNIHADIIVFPELATSGYFFLNKEETKNIGDRKDSPLIKAIQELSVKQNKIVIFGFPEITDEGCVYNSAAILFPNPDLSSIYRKTHLFYKERFCFDYGDTGFFVIEDKDNDIRIGTMICFDWRFPESARTLALKGADLIVCPSNLVTHVWPEVMHTRALENRVYFAVANRIGKEERNSEELIFNGYSVIYDYNGNILSKASKETEEVIYADITPKLARDKSINQINDIIKDRRPEMYIK